MFAISEDEKRLLELVKQKLYAPHIKTGDEIRDCAHQIAYVLDHAVEFDLGKSVELEKANNLILSMATVLFNKAVEDHIPYGLKDEAVRWIRGDRS